MSFFSSGIHSMRKAVYIFTLLWYCTSVLCFQGQYNAKILHYNVYAWSGLLTLSKNTSSIFSVL